MDESITASRPGTPDRPALPTTAAVWRSERAILTVLTGSFAGQVFSLEHPEMLIGHAADAEISIPDIGVGERHARIRRTLDGRFWLDDLGFQSETFVAGRPVTRLELLPGARVQLGAHVIVRFARVDPVEEALARHLYETSISDPLTGVSNRRYFDGRLLAEIAFARRHRLPLSVLLFSIDGLEGVNDSYGHIARDFVLRSVARKVSGDLRKEDVIARYEGAELGVILRGDRGRAALCAERIRRAVERLRIQWPQAWLNVTVSVGVADLEDGPAVDATALTALAKGRLYGAKSAGRNRVSA